MAWEHRRNFSNEEQENQEPRAGTKWWFIAGVASAAGTG